MDSIVSQWSDVHCSIDLVTAVKNEWQFLREINSYGGKLYEVEFLKNAIRRYEQCWLPLFAQANKLNLAPPLDVQLIWHAHMLCPLSYRRYCEDMFGRVLDHHLWNTQEMHTLLESSAELWRSHFPTEPFHVVNILRPQVTSVSQQPIPYDQKSNYDLVAAVLRQRSFHFQVGLPHYCSSRFLKSAVNRYKKFLFLQAQRPTDFLWPPYDVLLVWRSHQAHPLLYASDTNRLFGRVLPHDDQATHAQILHAEQLTHQFWRAHFPNEPYYKRGTQSRGYDCPTMLNLKAPSPDDHRHGKVHISGLNITSHRLDRSPISLKLLYDDRLIIHITKQQVNDKSRIQPCRVEWTSGKSKGALAIIKFTYDRRQMKSVRVKLGQTMPEQKKMARKQDRQKIQAIYPMEEFLDFWMTHSVLDDGIVYMHVQGEMDGKMVKADVGIEATITLKSRLNLTPGNFLGQKLISGQALADLAKIITGRADASRLKAYVASHWLNDLKRDAQYTVDIAHLNTGHQTLILVRDRRQHPLAMAHFIDPSTIPTAEDLEERVPVATPHVCDDKNEKFLSIVNRNGDFGIIKGAWIADHSDTGSLRAEFFNLGAGTVEIIHVPNSRNKTEFKLGAMTADLKSTHMECFSIHVAEHVACIFGLALLYNLCKNQHSPSDAPFSSTWPLLAAVGLNHGDKPVKKLSRFELPDEFAGL